MAAVLHKLARSHAVEVLDCRVEIARNLTDQPPAAQLGGIGVPVLVEKLHVSPLIKLLDKVLIWELYVRNSALVREEAVQNLAVM